MGQGKQGPELHVTGPLELGPGLIPQRFKLLVIE
jgi:hypothetical protein